jgi:UDP-N-acetylmuramoyl-L-alanyl-D-glutamate--2,6-diaminopimelate ligase
MRCIKDFRNKKIDWLVLETSSQALAQNRVWGIPYSIAVMTNVTHEHLDYHRTFERYREAKRKLFRWCDRNQHGLRVGVINADDPSAKLFAASIKRPITYGIERGDMKATKIALQPDGISYQVEHDKKIIYSIKCQLPGKFNVYNSLVAASIGNVLGLNRNQVEKGIAALESVEGRMTRVDEGQDFTVLVDFAHTPDSFEKLLSDMRPIVKGKMIVLFGSPGRRDEAKRAIQGEISGRYADVIVATEDDERDADGQEIMRQIAEGAELAGKVIGKDVFMVHNRTEAIQYAINLAHKGDAVLLLGKGHEKTIARADGDHPWNEVGAARTAIKNRLKEK